MNALRQFNTKNMQMKDSFYLSDKDSVRSSSSSDGDSKQNGQIKLSNSTMLPSDQRSSDKYFGSDMLRVKSASVYQKPGELLENGGALP